MKPYGPFDSVGNIALEIARMSGFQQGQSDFSMKRYETFTEEYEDLSPVEEARQAGYIDGWLGSYAAHCKKLTEKAS